MTDTTAVQIPTVNGVWIAHGNTLAFGLRGPFSNPSGEEKLPFTFELIHDHAKLLIYESIHVWLSI